MDARQWLSQAAARALVDGRQPNKVRHDLAGMLAQRVYGLCLGWADVCDHNVLREDLVLQTAVGRDLETTSADFIDRDGDVMRPVLRSMNRMSVLLSLSKSPTCISAIGHRQIAPLRTLRRRMVPV